MKTWIKRFAYMTVLWLIAITFIFLTGCNSVTLEDIKGGPAYKEMTPDNSLTFFDDNITGISFSTCYYIVDNVKFKSKLKYPGE